MPDRRGATLLQDLPEEMIDKILIRLPSKDVGRCRTVSTSWRSATSTPEFMLEHHRRQPSLPIVDGKGRPTNHVVLGAGACSQELWPFLPCDKQRTENCLHAACEGLLIVSQGLRFYICNPVIRRHALLPQPQGQDICTAPIGFYRHRPTGEHRVLLVSQSQSQRWLQPLPESQLYVVTAGAGAPRRVTIRMPTDSPPSVEQNVLNRLCCSFFCPPPAHHRGSLHWCPCGASKITGGGGDIIVFDTEAESFRWMRSPTQSRLNSKLFNMNGTLAFMNGTLPLQGSLTRSFTTLDVWVMQDYEAQIWAYEYRIDLSTVEVSRQLYLTSFKKEKRKKKKTPLDSKIKEFNDMAVLNERELLIMFNKKNVLRCDIDGKFLGIVKIGKGQYCMQLTQHRLQESIIPFPYHGLQEEEEVTLFSMVPV